MKKTKLKGVLALALTLVLTFGIGAAALAETTFTQTNGILSTHSESRFLAPGVEETNFYLNDKSGANQKRMHVLTVDPKTEGVGFMAGYADYGKSGWKMQSLRDQAAEAEASTGRNIVAAFNTDIYDMLTGEPTGPLVMNGEVKKEGIGQSYFGLTKDGEFKMGAYSMTAETLAEMQECTGAAWTMLVVNGQSTHWPDTRPAPRAAVGVKADGTLVFASLDGRNFPFAMDTSETELCDIMVGLGCVTAINLDGGGSSTYMSKGPEDEYLKLVSHPSDAVERAISSSFFVTYDGPAFEAPEKEETHVHSYTYADGVLACDCGETRETAGYTGFAKDGATGRNRYFINGKVHTKWLVYGDNCYYFDKDGLGHVGPLTTYSNGGKPRNYVFDEEGKQVGYATVLAGAGFPRAYFADGHITGWFQTDGQWHFAFDKGRTFDAATRKMYGYSSYYGGILMGGERKVFVPTHADDSDDDNGAMDSFLYTFDNEGNLTKGALATVEENTVYYWAYERYIGWTDIDGATYYFAPPCGFMVKAATLEIDGESCTFDKAGKLVDGHGKHDWSEWTQTKAPTATEEGEESRTCAFCKKTETRAVEKLAVMLGDVDGNNAITAADARLALRRAVDLEDYAPGSVQYIACDVDKVGGITAADARLILRAAVELEDPTKW